MLNRFLHRSYRFFYRFNLWVARRFTAGGLIVSAAVAATGIMGIDTNRALIYQGFPLLALLMGISAAWALFARIRIDVERALPRYGTVGEKLTYDLRVQNPTNRTQRGLRVIEEPDDPRPTMEEVLSTPEPGEATRNVWDRKTLYYRWVWLIDRNTRVHAAEQPLPAIPPRSGLDVKYEMTPLRRGPLYLDGLTVACPDPLGLLKSLKHIRRRQKMLILPKRYALGNMALPDGRRYQPGGIALASSVGNSQEFHTVRDYRPGDPPRHIHWRSWAKADRPIVKEFQDEFFVRHALVLDTFGGTGHSRVFEEAVSLAASFTEIALDRESLLDLMFVGAEAYLFSSGRSIAHVENMLEILACADLCPDRRFALLAALVRRHAARLSGVICILIDWDEDRRVLIEDLRALGIPLKVFLIIDPGKSDKEYPAPVREEQYSFQTLYAGNMQEGLTGS